MSTPTLPAFGDQLRAAREAAGLTQEELAERAGLTSHAISALERGKRTRPHPHTFRVLTDALGLTEQARRQLQSAVPTRGSRPDVPPAAAEPATAAEPAVEPAARPGARLPVPATELLGREDDVRALTGLLSRPGTRLVTLVGAGGVGKTRLAAAVSEQLEAQFADGAVHVPLAAVEDAALVLPTVGRAIGLIGVEGAGAAAVVTEHLAGARMLLVLDNVEHVLEAAPDVAALVAACPSLTVLATSRAPLRLRGEVQYRVEPLGLPPLGAASLAEASTAPAAELLLHRARALHVQLRDADAPALAALCHRLAGIPLALELVAARLRLLSPAQLLERLDDALAGAGPRDLPERQRTMRATLDWSYGLLAPDERRLLRLLSVFRGGCTLGSLEAVAGRDVLADLDVLVEHSLVVPRDDGRERRFALLEPVAQYARTLLDEEGETDAVRRAHALHFLDLAEQAAPEYERADQLGWLDRMEREDANTSSALQFSATEGDAEVAARLGWALWLYWWLRGHLLLGRRLMEQVAQRELPPGLRSRALLSGAAMAFAQADIDASDAGWTEALAEAERADDLQARAQATASLGLVALARGELPAAGERFRQTVPLAEQAGPGGDWVRALSLIWLGTVLLLSGSPADAAASVEQGLRDARRRGDRLAVYIGLYTLAQTALVQGDTPAARRHLEEGLVLSTEIADHANLAYLLEAIAVLEDPATADAAAWTASLLGAAEALREDVGAQVYSYYQPDVARRDAAVAQARRLLGDDGYDDALDAGRALGGDEAVALAHGQDGAQRTSA